MLRKIQWIKPSKFIIPYFTACPKPFPVTSDMLDEVTINSQTHSPAIYKFSVARGKRLHYVSYSISMMIGLSLLPANSIMVVRKSCASAM